MYTAFGAQAIGVDVPFDEAVELAAHFGFEGIYLDVGYLERTGPETVVQMLEERSLQAAGWHPPVRLTGDEDDFAAGLERTAEMADLCARTGAHRCSTWLPPASDEKTREELFELVRGRLVTVCEALAEHDTRLGLEFVGPATSRAGKGHEFIYTLDGTLELIDAVGAPNLGLLLDCWHIYTSGGDVEDVLRLEDEQVVDVHINDAPRDVPREEQVDSVRKLPGETGVIDVRRFLDCLQEISYSGPVMAEPLGRSKLMIDTMENILEVRDAIDSVWPDAS